MEEFRLLVMRYRERPVTIGVAAKARERNRQNRTQRHRGTEDAGAWLPLRNPNHDGRAQGMELRRSRMRMVR